MLWWKLRQLRSGDRAIRRVAASKLGDIKDPRAVAGLVSVLQDEDSDVRWNAAHALGKIGDPMAIEPLVAALQDADSGVRQVAAEGLGKFGDWRAIEPLMSALTDKGKEVREAAANSLQSLGWQPVNDLQRACLAVALRRWDEAVALGAVAEQPLLIARQDKDPLCRKSAAMALRRLRGVQATDGAEVESVGPNHNGDQVEEVGPFEREEAISESSPGPATEDVSEMELAPRALGEGILNPSASRETNPQVQTLMEAFRDDDWRVRVDAVESLVQLGDPAVDALAEVLVREELWGLRKAAAGALGRIGGARVVESLQAALRQDGNSQVRAEAATALESVGDASAIVALLAALNDQDAQVKKAAQQALTNLHVDWEHHSGPNGQL